MLVQLLFTILSSYPLASTASRIPESASLAAFNINDYYFSWTIPYAVDCALPGSKFETVQGSALQSAAVKVINAASGSYTVQIHSAAAKAAGLHIAFKFDVDPGQNDKRAVLQNGEHNKPLYIYSKGVAVYDAAGRKYLNKDCAEESQHD